MTKPAVTVYDIINTVVGLKLNDNNKWINYPDGDFILTSAREMYRDLIVSSYDLLLVNETDAYVAHAVTANIWHRVS